MQSGEMGGHQLRRMPSDVFLQSHCLRGGLIPIVISEPETSDGSDRRVRRRVQNNTETLPRTFKITWQNISEFSADTISGRNASGGRLQLAGMTAVCMYWNAKMWPWKKFKGSVRDPRFKLCCGNGKIRLPALQPPPEPILSLLTAETREAREFRHRIRAYDNVFAFCSLAVNLDETLANAVGGAYTFRINGSLSHLIGPLLPTDNAPPALPQIYIHDPETQAIHRRQIFGDLDPVILLNIQDMLLEVNPFAATLQTAAGRMRENPNADFAVEIVRDSARGCRQYAAPATAEVAVVIPNGGNQTNGPARRDVVYVSKEGELFRINETHSYYEPVTIRSHFPKR